MKKLNPHLTQMLLPSALLAFCIIVGTKINASSPAPSQHSAPPATSPAPTSNSRTVPSLPSLPPSIHSNDFLEVSQPQQQTPSPYQAGNGANFSLNPQGQFNPVSAPYVNPFARGFPGTNPIKDDSSSSFPTPNPTAIVPVATPINESSSPKGEGSPIVPQDSNSAGSSYYLGGGGGDSGNTSSTNSGQSSGQPDLSLQQQSIDGFPSAATISLSADYITLPGTTIEGLAISYSLGEGSPATLSGDTLTLTGLGTVIVTAYQRGNSSYANFLAQEIITVVAPSPDDPTSDPPTSVPPYSGPTTYTPGDNSDDTPTLPQWGIILMSLLLLVVALRQSHSVRPGH